MTARWVKYGARTGWQEVGIVPVGSMGGTDFWAAALRVTGAAEGGHVDMVQCYDLGIFSAGPIGASAQSGALVQLIRLIPQEIRERHLGALFAKHGISLTDRGLERGMKVLRTVDELRAVFTGGSDALTWTEAQKEAALEWITAFSGALREPAVIRAMGNLGKPVLMPYLYPAAQNAFSAHDGYVQPTAVVRKAIACYLAFSVNNPSGATRLLAASGAAPGLPATAETILETASKPSPLWPTTFGQRVGRTRAALDKETW